jgi:hypothetical protein
MSDNQPTPKSPQRTRVPRPDELTPDTFEFIAAIDEFKRTRMVSIVTLENVLGLLNELGYLPKRVRKSQLADLESAVETYKKEHDRLFPNWSEIFQVVMDLGYARDVA